MAQTIPCSQVLVARGVYLLAVQVANFVLYSLIMIVIFLMCER